MKWFDNPQTLEDLKQQYKRLAMAHHPDRGGNTKDMQEINGEYDQLFQQLKNIHKAANGTTYTTAGQSSEKAADFREIIDILIRFTGLNIEICGSWLWISGDTKPHKEELKRLKFRWSQSKRHGITIPAPTASTAVKPCRWMKLGICTEAKPSRQISRL